MNDLALAFLTDDETSSLNKVYLRILESIYKVWGATKSIVESNICQGLVAYCIQLRWFKNPIMFTSVTGPPVWLSEEHVVTGVGAPVATWVLLNIASAISLDTLFSPRAINIVAQLLESYPETRNWDVVLQSIRLFFHPAPLLSRWHILWTEAAARRGCYSAGRTEQYTDAPASQKFRQP